MVVNLSGYEKWCFCTDIDIKKFENDEESEDYEDYQDYLIHDYADWADAQSLAFYIEKTGLDTDFLIEDTILLALFSFNYGFRSNNTAKKNEHKKSGFYVGETVPSLFHYLHPPGELRTK